MQLFAGFAATVPAGASVLDVGSYDVNGCLRPLFSRQDYTGIDMAPGPNVDIVCEKYDFGQHQYDYVISANTMEHVEAIWKWVLAIDDVVKPGGVIAIHAPAMIAYHAYPIHCWNIRKDGMRYIFTDWMTESGRKPYNITYCDETGIDCFLIATKPE